ncbi:protein adenylyltransferase SelO [Hymenobacter aerophilus]|uniref:protein adenylyltransferase SelO n=1 Tax=Hymenobacter aerophilus TaxID=119644 RepID=UPI0003762ED4|nr:YdiU family protein [Hymenobacter aerophilus]
MPQPLENATFTNSFVDELAGDPSRENAPRQVPGYHYSPVAPTPVAAPRLLEWSQEMGTELGLVRPSEQGAAVELLAGNRVADSMRPYAARYGGHQFGNWAGQLGDGRAISLGELAGQDGRRWEIQLKGAGPTPYSRRADGRAVLRSSVREFLCSEAMHHLGVFTTRALSLVSTGDEVLRDMFYDGNARPEPGAIVARVAPSFVRFGNFQILLAHDETDNLRALADYVIRHHFPELGAPDSPEVYVAWLTEIARRTAEMVAHWQTVGFVHGVLNTDNMSILGLTIDYGPYGWLEPYEPGWTPNTTDFTNYRYAFGQQPQVCLWNLTQLAQALTPLVPDPELLRPALNQYVATFNRSHHVRLLAKLGLTASNNEEADKQLVGSLLPAMEAAQVDMTLFYRHLSHLAPRLLAGELAEESDTELLRAASYAAPEAEGAAPLRAWLEQYAARLRQEPATPEAIRDGMLTVNPKYVLRNYLAQQAIEAAEAGDLAPLHTLHEVLKRPFDEQPEHEALAARRPAWAATKPGSATLSCSS